MKSELKFILFWCCVWCFQEASTDNISNNTYLNHSEEIDSNSIDENAKPVTSEIKQDEKESLDYGNFIVKVIVGATTYTGTLITGKTVVASPNVPANNVKVCSLNDTDCSSPVYIEVNDQDLAIIDLANSSLPEPVIFEGNFSSASCTAGGVHHGPTAVKITNDEVDCESDCEDFDAVVCDNQIAGILVDGPSFSIIHISELYDEIIYRKIRIYNDTSEDETTDIFQSETEEEKIKQTALDYGNFAVKVTVGVKVYTGTLITGKVVVANPNAKDDDALVCSFKGTDCTEPEYIKINNRNFAIIKLPNYLPEPTPFYGDLSAASCTAGGVNHDPIPLKITDDGVDCNMDCENFDTVVCDNKLVGILTGAPAFTIANINGLHDDLDDNEPSQETYDEDQEEEKVDNSMGTATMISQSFAIILVSVVLLRI